MSGDTIPQRPSKQGHAQTRCFFVITQHYQQHYHHLITHVFCVGTTYCRVCARVTQTECTNAQPQNCVVLWLSTTKGFVCVLMACGFILQLAHPWVCSTVRSTVLFIPHSIPSVCVCGCFSRQGPVLAYMCVMCDFLVFLSVLVHVCVCVIPCLHVCVHTRLHVDQVAC